jgi:glycosyltransferase involved in cell wall biosynthesis
VGDGPERRALERQVAALALGQRVTFAGHVDNVEEWLPAMDLFVLPSCEDEGVPPSILEAMACGLAVVSTRFDGISEAVLDGATGLLAPARDVPALARALGELMEDPLRRARMAEAALSRARSEFALEAMVDRMEQVYLRHARGRA